MSLLKRAILLAILLAPVFASAQNILASDASKHLGELETVCGKIATVRVTTAVQGTPTLIDFEKPYPNQTFTAVVWEKDQASVGKLPRVGTICVKGQIVQYGAKPGIVLHNSGDWASPETQVNAQTTLSNDKHYINSDGQVVHSPAYSSGGIPAGTTAQCVDGTYSFSTHRRGTCSHHGGVAKWL